MHEKKNNDNDIVSNNYAKLFKSSYKTIQISDIQFVFMSVGLTVYILIILIVLK